MRKRWSTTIRTRIWQAFDKTCQLCKQPTDRKGFDLDHRIPLALGGEDVEANLHPLCRPCHKLKTQGDVKTIAKAKRVEARHTGSKVAKGDIKSAGFAPAEPQRRASRPIDKLAQLPRPQLFR